MFAATLLGPTAMAAACPGDGGPAPAEIKNHFCGTWNAAEARGLNPGTPLNNAFRFGGGWWRDFDGGAFGRGAIVEGDGVGFAYIVGQPWFNPYTGLGGPNSPLGYPVGRAEFGGHINNGARENKYMTFQGGVMNSWAAGTFATWGAIRTKWDQLGDVSGPVGRPLSNEQQTARVNGRFSAFEGGNIIYNPRINVASLVYGGILNKYRDLGFSNHPLGLPTGDRQYNPFRGNEYQTFDGGVINQYGGRAFETHGALLAKWQALGGPNGPVGLPTSDEQQTARVNGRFATFQGGNLIFNPATGQTAHVYGGILNKYAQLGYSNHPLGLPTDDRRRNATKGNDYQTFQGGVINQYGGNAFETHGAILAKWGALGGPNGPVGLPTSDEQQTARVNGRFATFQGGNLIHDVRTGQTFHVYGGILNKYAQLGYSNHPLGLPTSDRKRNSAKGNDYQTFQGGVINQYGGRAFETHGEILRRWQRGGGPGGPLGLPTSDEGRAATSPYGTTGAFSRFQNGLINSSRKGTHVLFGSIGTKFARMGYSRSYLGFPTSEEFNASGGKRQNFEGGFILYKRGIGARNNRELDRPVPRPPKPYVVRVMGDSISAGFGLNSGPAEALACGGSTLSWAIPSEHDIPSRLPTSKCDYPFGSWGNFVARRLQNRDLGSRSADIKNLAVSGSTPGDWLSGENPRGDVRDFPTRLRRVIEARPDLIMLSLGANDLLADRDCARTPACANSVIRKSETKMKQLLAKLSRETRAKIYVLLYFNIEDDEINAVGTLNAALRRAVKSAPRTYWVTPPPFADGHQCKKNRNGTWMLGYDGCLHPNSSGVLAITNSVYRTIKRFGY